MSARSHALEHAPVGGPVLTQPMKVLLAFVALGAAAAVWRFAAGLAAVSNLSDGYPWGLWIAFDVVVGTALGCGGYAVALLVYVLNRGKYHRLVRPAVLTSLLGYGLAVLAVSIDLGRPWLLWKVPLFYWRWTRSPQLEVALCVAAYTVVLMIELAPAWLEKLAAEGKPRWHALAERWLPRLEKALPWILALGMLLPTMHQSSLGTMILLTGPRLHPLWFTPWLPFLFLVSCLVMGYGVVVLEATFSSRAFHREKETAMLASLSKVAAAVALFWAVFRLAEITWSGELALLATAAGALVVLEIALHAGAAGILASAARRASPTWQVRAGLLLVVGGALYRIDSYLVAFRPGEWWHYTPALPELAITFGIVALEVALYLWAVKRLPILAGNPAAAR